MKIEDATYQNVWDVSLQYLQGYTKKEETVGTEEQIKPEANREKEIIKIKIGGNINEIENKKNNRGNRGNQ